MEQRAGLEDKKNAKLIHLDSQQHYMCYFYFSKKILLMVLAIFVMCRHTNWSLEALGIN